MSLSNNFPAVRPSLLLDFANTKTLDPRITFTRGSTGTFYDGKTVAKAEENLWIYSQEFDNATWTKNTGVTVTANSVTAPDGTTTADTLAGGSGNIAYITKIFNRPASAVYSCSVYAKAGSTNFLQITNAGSGWTNNEYANFDLSAGTVGTVGSAATASISSVGNGWYRCSITATTTGASSDTNFFAYIAVESSTAARFASSAGVVSIYLWGAQLEQRSSVTAYTPTTTASITNYIPALQTAGNNVPRFEHNPITGESLGLEIEEQRTNLLTYSSEFDNAVYTKADVSIEANATVAPDGTLTADRLIENTANAYHRVASVFNSTSGTTYTLSVYAKTNGRQYLVINAASLFNGRAFFDLVNGTVTAGSGTASITPVGNGWYRCVVTATATASVLQQCYVGTNTSATDSAYLGNGFSGAFLWGLQLEVGSFATSYIPTVASQVTRSADVAQMTGANFSSWYRQGEGTIYAESSFFNTTRSLGLYAFDDGTTNNVLNSFGGTAINANARVNGANVFTSFSSTLPSAIAFYKQGFAYGATGYASVFNGGTPTTQASGAVPANLNRLQIGVYNDNYFNSTIKKIAYYPRRLTNSEIQSLTTV